jgi:DNA-binding MarR family transcriptional regulator
VKPGDSVDDHVARWQRVLPTLDPVVEGVVKRMSLLTRHLAKVKERSLADEDLQPFEYFTLHALAGRGGRATPSELVADLQISPSSLTGRTDILLKRGFVERRHSETDRRRVDIELTATGRRVWRSALEAQGDEEGRILGALTADERAVLTGLLSRMLDAAQRPVQDSAAAG